MKKISSFVLAVIMLVIAMAMAGGCAPRPPEPAQAPPKKPIEITFPIRLAPETVEVMAAEEFKRLVEERSKGRIKVNIFPGGVLGGERDNIEQIQLNEAQITNIGDLLPTLLAPTYAAPTVPFIFPDIKAVRAFWDGDIGQRKRAVIEGSGVVVVGLQERLPRNLTSKRPIHTVEDLKGLKLRVPDIASWIRVWTELGAIPTPIAWAEVYTSLLMGVVDAQENPYAEIVTAKFFEVQRYLMHTKHLTAANHWVASKEFLDNLSPEDRALILKAVEEAIAWGDAKTAARGAEWLQELKNRGMVVIEVDREAFRKAAKPAIERLAAGWAPGVKEEVDRLTGAGR
jgi:tripartite ATP-independent transporter DctP family solute receptor